MSANETVTFRYFADPHHFSTYVDEAKVCDICQQIRPGYADSFFTPEGKPNIRFVCEPCLHQGRLESVEAQVNISASDELRTQIAEIRKDWDEGTLERYALQQTREVEICTPSIVTWQDYEWPAHCGDFMRYVKDLGQADCAALSDKGDGFEFFNEFLEHTYKEGDTAEVAQYVSDLWDRMRPDSPQDNNEITSTSFYLFQCTECGSYLIEWDTD